MHNDKIRHQVMLGTALSERLDLLAHKPGATKSAIMAVALEAWLNRQGMGALEDRFGLRLNRISNQLARIERDGHIVLETLALFIRYQLTVSAPLPEGDAAARAVGRDRYEAFIKRVGQQLASGKRAIATELIEAADSEAAGGDAATPEAQNRKGGAA